MTTKPEELARKLALKHGLYKLNGQSEPWPFAVAAILEAICLTKEEDAVLCENLIKIWSGPTACAENCAIEIRKSAV